MADSKSDDLVSKYSPAPWRAEPYKVESGCDPNDYGSWAVFDSRPNTLPLALLDHHRDGHGGFRASVGKHAQLIAAAPELLALAKEYASSCINCTGWGFTYQAGEAFTQEETARERIECEECAHIRELIANAEGRS